MRAVGAAELLVEILAILAVGGVASGLRAWLFDSAATRVMARLRMRLFNSLMAQEMGTQHILSGCRTWCQGCGKVVQACRESRAIQLDIGVLKHRSCMRTELLSHESTSPVTSPAPLQGFLIECVLAS